MGVLDQVMQLKNQGYSEQDIKDNLQQQGISPKQITDAINQAKIKNAVSSQNPEADDNPPTPGTPPGPPASSAAGTQGEQGYYTPQTQPMQATETMQPAYQQAPAEYYEETAYAPTASTGIDSDTIIEIANQVFSEKIRKTEKRLEELEELKTIAKVKVNNLDERLKRIEKMIDTLQVQILEKVGSYGRELQSTKKEVSMLEDTIGKTIKTKARKKSSKTKKKKTSSRKKR